MWKNFRPAEGLLLSQTAFAPCFIEIY